MYGYCRIAGEIVLAEAVCADRGVDDNCVAMP